MKCSALGIIIRNKLCLRLLRAGNVIRLVNVESEICGNCDSKDARSKPNEKINCLE